MGVGAGKGGIFGGSSYIIFLILILLVLGTPGFYDA